MPIKVTVQFNEGAPPDVPMDTMTPVIVAVLWHHSQKPMTFAAFYLNEYLTDFDENLKSTDSKTGFFLA